MKEYEKISDVYQICWNELFDVKNKLVMQVSGYIFDDKNRLLIVKSGKHWTVPGGHPEAGETALETLNREVYEEACVVIDDAKYIGAVEVLEDGNVYYQMRYVARVKEIHEFNTEFETTDRLFIPLENLGDYIKWSNGVTFKQQIETACKIMEIE